MAKFTATKDPDPIDISKFLGINEAVGETEIALGELIELVNFRITNNFKPQKRPGHNTYWNFGNALAAQGMWKGTIAGVETLVACQNGHVWRDKAISGTIYDALVTTYTNVDVVKTTALAGSEAGSTGIDGVALVKNSAGAQLTEVALASVDLVASVGKYYFDADEKINYIVAKGAYATIALARTGLGTTTALYRIGTLTDAKTSIFYFEDKLYFLNGTDYKEWNGTTYQDVDPYIPTVAVGTPPAGGGTVFEPINLLTGKKKQAFIGNGVATAYQLAETVIDAALVTCTVNGVTKTETTDFTVNRTTGIVTFTVAPADESEVILGWTKVEVGNSDLVKKNKYTMDFGPGNDTAIFLWGNPDEKNRRMWSGTLKANYFPVTNYTYIGSNEYGITDIRVQNSRQVIFKENQTHYSEPEWNTTALLWDYPVYDVNEKIGNVCPNGVQIIKNNPISLFGQSFWEWTNTYYENDKAANPISDRIKQSLSELDLSTAVTFDYIKEKEYWCNVGEYVYIYNYGNSTFYIYDNISATCFLEDDYVYYGSQGTIERFDGENDNGVAINAYGILGFEDWNELSYKKSTDKIFSAILPDTNTSLVWYYKTNKINAFKEIKPIEYHFLDFNNIDFNNFSFLTNRNPQVFKRRIRANSYTFIQFKFENKELNQTCTLLSLQIPAELQGEV